MEFTPVCIGAKTDVPSVRPGGRIYVETAYKNLGGRPARCDYQGFVHLEQGSSDCTGIAAVLDCPPVIPTTVWRRGDIIRDGPFVLSIPPDAKPGEYYVHAGLFAPDEPGMPRLCEGRLARVTIDPEAPQPPPQRPSAMSGAEQSARKARLVASSKGMVGIADRAMSFAVASNGNWALADKASGEIWRSNPSTQRFAVVSATRGTTTVTLPVDCFASVRRESEALRMVWAPESPSGFGRVTFTARLLPGERGLRVTWNQAGGQWRLSQVRFPDSSFWATGDEGGCLVVPNRMGILVPASENRPCVQSYQTYYSYGGLSMSMAGVLKRGSGLLVWWEDPYTRLETCRSWPDLPQVPAHSMVDISVVQRASAGGITIQPVGRGGYASIARAYREVARKRGLLKTWRDKFSDGQSPMSGRAYFRTLALYNYAPNTRFNSSSERRKSVGFTFSEIASTAEHLRNDLGIERGMYVVSGWMKNGYDNQHPDILPASPECGGDEGLAECSRRIRDLGYLFGLHDCYQDIYRDAPSWDAKYVMRYRDGTLQKGGEWFGGQSYLTRAESALQLAQRDQNLPSVKRLFDPDFYYIDTTFAVPLHEDFSPEHPAGRDDDLRWKQKLAAYARGTIGMFGSEEGVEWGVPVADYFESMLFQRTQRQTTEVLLPLFEMVYGDCVNIYQGDRTTTTSPAYVLDHILCAEMPQCDVYKAGAPDIACRVAAARRVDAGSIELTYEWKVGSTAPRLDYTCFVHFVPARQGNLARESAAFAGDHDFAAPSSQWAPGSSCVDGPHRVQIPAGTTGTFRVLAGLLDGGRRVPLRGIDAGNQRFLVADLHIDGDRVTVSDPRPLPEMCFARCDSNPTISFSGEGLLVNLYNVLSPLQRITADSPMTEHMFLTSDRQVERSRFGDVTITVNYGDRPFAAGRAVLPKWGFLVESPKMVAFRADSYAGRRFAETTMASVASEDGMPLTASGDVRFYRAHGDDCRSLIMDSVREAGKGRALSSDFTNSLGIPMRAIHPGTFRMGQESGGDWDERPVHPVTISRPFHMAGTEVTNAQYEQFDPAHRAYRGQKGLSSGDDEAVVFVSWEDAERFCRWLSAREGRPYRLPTEAEWEYACRAGTETQFSTGDSLPPAILRPAKPGWEPAAVSLRVGASPPNPWGLHDMHGNVEEWCLDWYGPYEPGPGADPVGRRSGEMKVTRGGSHNSDAHYLRSANRLGSLPGERSWMIGFRVVMGDIPSTPPLSAPEPPQWARNVSQSKHERPAPSDMDAPLFDGPIPFVLIPPDAAGPLFPQHNHAPSIAACPNGDVLAVWFSCLTEEGREMTIAASRLPRGSRYWGPADEFFKAPDRNMTGSALYCSEDGTLYHFNSFDVAKGWANLAIAMRTSTDNGVTWESRIIVPEHGLRNQVISGVIRTHDGRLVLPCDAVTTGEGGTAVHLSSDNGATWTDAGAGTPPPEFVAGASGGTIAGIHAGIVELRDGSLLALGRGNSIDGRMPMGVSRDGGRTWAYSPSVFPPIGTNQRLVLMRLREGPILLLSFTDPRYAEERKGIKVRDAAGVERTVCGVYAAVSCDEGRTWDICRPIAPGDHSCSVRGSGEELVDPEHGETWGYLAATQTPDGVIHLLSSRLYYRFNLAWLKQPMPAKQHAGEPESRPIDGRLSPIRNTFDSASATPRLPVERVWIHQPDGSWTYSHHPQIGFFNGRFMAMWSNGRSDEDQPGQRVMLSTSADFSNWTPPIPLADSQPGEFAESALAAGGFYASGGTLVAYISQWEYTPESIVNGEVKVLGKGHTRNRLRALTSQDGVHWSGWHDIALPVGPNHPPRPIASGRLLMSSNFAMPYSDDPSGLAGWRMAGIYPADHPELFDTREDAHALLVRLVGLDVPLLCEGSFYQTDDGVLHMLLRTNTEWLWVTESSDDGITWSFPLRTAFSDNATKFQFGRLPDGRFYYVGCPAPQPRWLRSPLVLSLSEDGVRFDRHFIIADDPYPMKCPAYYKGGEYGYPSTLVRDGYLYVIVSRQKEAVEVIRAPIPPR